MSTSRRNADLKVERPSRTEILRLREPKPGFSKPEALPQDHPLLGNKNTVINYALNQSENLELSKLSIERAGIVTKYLLEFGDYEIARAEANARLVSDMSTHQLKPKLNKQEPNTPLSQYYSEPEESDENASKLFLTETRRNEFNNSEVMTSYTKRLLRTMEPDRLHAVQMVLTMMNLLVWSPNALIHMKEKAHKGHMMKHIPTNAGLKAHNIKGPYDNHIDVAISPAREMESIPRRELNTDESILCYIW